MQSTSSSLVSCKPITSNKFKCSRNSGTLNLLCKPHTFNDRNLICPGHLPLNCIGVYLLTIGCATLFSHCLLYPAHSYGENTLVSFCLSSVGWISAFGLSGLSVGPGKSVAVIISGLLQVARSHVAICVSIGSVNEIRLFSN